MTDQDTIIRRIQKLLARTEGNPSQEEANAALSKAQELLARYNLELEVVRQTHVVGGTLAPAEEKREKVKFDHSAMYQWQVDLWSALASHNFCWYWVRREFHKMSSAGTSVYLKRHVVLGSKANVIGTRLMGEYLCETMERLLPFPNQERLSRSAMSWRSGCVQALKERLWEQKESLRQETESEAGCTAVTLRSVEQREYEANYDAIHGAGSYAQEQAERARRNAEWDKQWADEEARAAEQNAQGLDAAVSAMEAETAAETPAQTARRMAREEKARAQEALKQIRRDQRARRAARREAAKIDWSAYNQGNTVGRNIPLTRQVPEKNNLRLK